MSETNQFIQLKKALASHADLNTLKNEGGDSNLGDSVVNFLEQIKENGIPEGFTWEEAKSIIISKFDEVTKAFEAERPISSLSPIPNVDNYTFEEYRERIVSGLNRFETASPFTLGRICELLLEPKKHYDRGDKFLRAFEKCITVTSTNEANGNGHHANGHENGTNGHENGSNGHAVHAENGSAMEINNSQEGGVVTGESKQEDAVSSSVVDAQQENGHSEQNVIGTSGQEVERPATETKPEPAGETTTEESENVSSATKRQTEEPETVAKKARTEDVAEGQNGAVAENGHTAKSHEVTGEAIVTDQQAGADQGTAV